MLQASGLRAELGARDGPAKQPAQSSRGAVAMQATQNALHRLADRGRAEELARLLRSPAWAHQASARDLDGRTPLHFACFSGHLEAAQVPHFPVHEQVLHVLQVLVPGGCSLLDRQIRSQLSIAWTDLPQPLTMKLTHQPACLGTLDLALL